MKEFPNKYKHTEVEKKWQDHWVQQKSYAWNPSLDRSKNFVIDTPPPSVSGTLHMGHICSYTQTDFIARYQRMKGKNVFYPMGFDDNGLPTERLVEKVKKVKAHQTDKKEFQKLCKEVIKDAEDEFKRLFDGVALSVDWSQKYQTVSDHSTLISQMSFIDLFEKQAIYRAFEPTIWDPVDGTALAQADLEEKEVPGVMNDINFALENGDTITIATTRPELLPACVAILYHPEDSRYSHLKGQFAVSPVFGVKVPIVADDTVDIEKGTGAVMCCTFGDITDIEWWKKHKLDTRVIVNKYGKIELQNKLSNPNFPFCETKLVQETIERLEGKKVLAAREEIIKILQENELLLAQKETVKIVKCAERSKAIVEIIVTPQWFIKVLDKKKELLEKAAECEWNPSFMKARVDNWINGLNWDWCISRQRYFGVPFPIWYSKRKGEEGKILVADTKSLPIDPANDLPSGYRKDEVEPETDVMDTWATSSVSPQINSHAINEKCAIDYKRHEKLFPADIRSQAHEIIRTWAFYTIVKSMYHEDIIPWKKLVISGWVLAADKTKMSKSKGNIVTPIGLISEKSADVVRYWAASAKLGQDIVYSEDMFQIGKKLVNKLWNASKFVSIHLQNINFDQIDTKKDINNVLDKWILSKLHKTINRYISEFEKFEYSIAKSVLEDFFWNDLCDNYLEFVKIRIYDEDGKDQSGKKSAATTMVIIFDAVLKLFAPFLPYITEELHDILFSKGSVHGKGMLPDSNKILQDNGSEEVGENVVEIVDVIRKYKAEREISIKSPISEVTILCVDKKYEFLDTILDLKNVMNISKLDVEILNGKKNNLIETSNGQFFISIKE
ncbi:MAG: valine--tRNA ligase [Alphaproteobacteria bacterium]|nr:valine--tRNA ligase [Alphaproteobacteria bacterium]